MADIKKIKLPNGTEFDIKDETARSQMEVSANKVTSINSASTDSQYPSAKAVYLAVQASGQLVAYTFTDTDSGNIIIGQTTVAQLDDQSF